jgi:tRNA nucleotidyltransferase (CCA-adding enzyme)
MKSESNEFIIKIAEICKANSGTAYKVGGCVRDKLLGFEPKDIDLEIFGIDPHTLQSLMSLLGSVSLCGQSFGILKVTDPESEVTIDVGIPRKERAVGSSHRDFIINSDGSMTPEDASNRRDFTINAIYQNVLTEEILDFHGGVSDLHAGIIRCVNESRFMEDPLRILRAIQFAARFQFIIEQDTFELLKQNANAISNLPSERIFEEISKLLLKAPKPSYGFHLMQELGLLDTLFPEISVLQFVEQNPEYHPEGNVFNHTMNVIDWYPPGERTIELQLAGLYHDAGKLYGSRKHELHSIEIIREEFPKKLTNNIELISSVINLVEHHMQLYGGKVTRGRVKRLAAKTDLLTLLQLHAADKFSRGLDPTLLTDEVEHLEKYYKIFHEVQHEVAPLIHWRDVPEEFNKLLLAGPIRSKILKEVYEAQLDDKFSTKEAGLIELNKVITKYLGAI